jgi:predicted Zn-dependent protease
MPNVPPFDYQFGAVADFTGTFLEPVSFPGGYVFIPAGLILKARDEAEFAGLLAHAMAHVLTWHNEWKKGVRVPFFFVADQNNAGAITLPPSMRAADESEADRMAVQFTASAGYDPAGLARYIARVQPAPTVSNALAGYPVRNLRIRAIEQAIRALPRQKYASSTDFARIQDEVRRLINQ